MKTIDHAVKNRLPRRWLHVNLRTQLTIKKDILNIKLRPVAKRGHDNKCANNGHMGQMRKSLVAITTVLLLKARSHMTSFVALKRTMRASFNLVGPLTSDGTNMRRKRNKTPCTGALKSSNLLGHHKLSFMMDNNIMIRSHLKNNNAIAWKTKAVNKQKWTNAQAISWQSRGRWHIGGRCASVDSSTIRGRRV